MTRSTWTRAGARLLALGACLAVLSGCPRPVPFSLVRQAPDDVAPADAALVVLLRPQSGFDPLKMANVYLDGQYLVTLGVNTRYAVRLSPGPHRFMVIGETIDLMDAEVEAGKTYHARVRAYYVFVPGLSYDGHFAFEPINASSDALRGWYMTSTLVEPNAAGAEWGADALERMEDDIPRYTERWEAKPVRQVLDTPTSH